jgi:hypothetical protein
VTSFAFLSRWVEPPERRRQPRSPEADPAVDHERLEAVRGLTKGHLLTGGVVGLTALSLVGWIWRRGGNTPPDQGASG